MPIAPLGFLTKNTRPFHRKFLYLNGTYFFKISRCHTGNATLKYLILEEGEKRFRFLEKITTLS